MVVDKLAAVVAVDSPYRERESDADTGQRGEHPPLRLVTHGAVLGPPQGDVGDGQGGAEVAGGVAALVPDQVDLHEPRYRIIPLGPGPDRDRILEQRTRLGMR